MGAFFAPKRALINEHQGQSSDSVSQKRVTLLPGGLPSISSGRAAKFEDFPTRNVPRGTTLSLAKFHLGKENYRLRPANPSDGDEAGERRR